MNPLEKRILSWIDRLLPLIVLLAAAFLGLKLRLPLLDFVSGDSTFFLLPWYDQIRENGLYVQVGDYNLVYQLIIWLLTFLPLEPLYAYKLVSILFDYFLALSAGLFTWHLSQEDRVWKGIFACSAVLISPVIALNSAAWAQCDAIWVCFSLLALTAMVRDRYNWAMILLGISFSFKLQSVFLLPVFLFAWYQNRKFSIVRFLLIPLTMCLMSLPAVFFGRSLTEVFSIYGNQTDTWPFLSMNYPSLWLLLADAGNGQYELLKPFTMVLTVGVLALQMLSWIRRGIPAQGKNLLYMAFLLTYSCVLLLPAMHERYGYLYEVLAIVIACLQPATLPLCLGLIGISLCTYGQYLFKIQALNLMTLTVLNLVIFVYYLMTLNKKLTKE